MSVLEAFLQARETDDFDFRHFANPDDPLKHLFAEWVQYYRDKHALCRALAPDSILEIGVRFGYSAATFLDACPPASYLGLDNDSDASGGQRGALAWARRITAGRDARFQVTDTQMLDQLPGERWDLIHIDGQQDGDGTLRDLELALEKGRYILVDGFFWSRQNLEASTHFLQKYRSLIEYAIVLPGYAGELLIRAREGSGFTRSGRASRDYRALRSRYTREYFLQDCGGYEAFKSAGGRRLADNRLITLFGAGAPWDGKRVLDMGSGRGELSHACYRAGATVTGVDYSEAAYEISRDTYRAELGARLEFVCADLLDYAPAARFDRIVAADFVEHIDPQTLHRAFARMREWLAPGGRVLIHTWPNRLAYERRQRLRRTRARDLGIYIPRNQRSLYEDEMHLNEQTPGSLRRSLRRSFPHVTVWVGTAADPAAGLRATPSRALMMEGESVYAVASDRPIDVAALTASLTQDGLSPPDLAELELSVARVPAEAVAGSMAMFDIELRNHTTKRIASLPPFPVHLSYHWYRDAAPVVFDGVRTRLDVPLEPGQVRRIAQEVLAPSDPGTYDLVLTLVQEGRFWLDAHSTRGLVDIPGFRVRPAA